MLEFLTSFDFPRNKYTHCSTCFNMFLSVFMIVSSSIYPLAYVVRFDRIERTKEQPTYTHTDRYDIIFTHQIFNTVYAENIKHVHQRFCPIHACHHIADGTRKSCVSNASKSSCSLPSSFLCHKE